MTRVVHCKKEPYDVYIGRGKNSKWGNPFSHKEGTLAKYKVETREKAIEAFKKWITEGEGQYLLNDLHELKGKVLGCWCGSYGIEDKDNLKCHGQILIELIYSKRLF